MTDWSKWNDKPFPSNKIGTRLRIRMPDGYEPADWMGMKIKQAKINKPMENKPMTRDEAIEKVQAITQSSVTNREIADTVDILETLGLLKFDEPKPKAETIIKNAREAYGGMSGDYLCNYIEHLLDIIDNKYDDIKCVKLGEMFRADVEPYREARRVTDITIFKVYPR